MSLLVIRKETKKPQEETKIQVPKKEKASDLRLLNSNAVPNTKPKKKREKFNAEDK